MLHTSGWQSVDAAVVTPVCLSVVQTKVLQVKQRSDFSHSGQWNVETENKDGKKEKHIFDAVMICVGHHCHPNMPLHDFPGTIYRQ